MNDCLIALGTNAGNRRGHLETALHQLDQLPQSRLVARSQPVETPPIGGDPRQSWYLNAAARLDTQLSPQALLIQLNEIEQRLGRGRRGRWTPRTMDLDLLLYGDHILREPELCVPHPRMCFRRFVLAPAAQIASKMVHPQSRLTIGELLDRLDRLPNSLALLTRQPPRARRWLSNVSQSSGVNFDFGPFQHVAPLHQGADDEVARQTWRVCITSDFEKLAATVSSIKLLTIELDRQHPHFERALTLPVATLVLNRDGEAALELAAALYATYPFDLTS